tara:strand:+ start:285 stop:1682 length:1398 start_codon:yes stop_codon:yes gene_type:complete
MGTKSTQEDFLKKAKAIHGTKYDYSKVKYVRAHSHIEIICKKHGPWRQQPSSHLMGNGCKQCAIENAAQKYRTPYEEVIKRAKKIHNGLYDYLDTSSSYKNSKSKLKIICKEHGKFEQRVSHHLYRKAGCKKCADKNRNRKRALTTKEFIKRAKKLHKNKYDYSNTEYKNYHSALSIICPKHGEFRQVAASHLDGSGCASCGKEKKEKSQTKTTEQFIKDAINIHGKKYDYKKTKYVGSHKKVIITCKIHGDFEQTPTSHLRPSGCQKCKYDLFKKLFVFSKDEFISKAKEVHGNVYDYSEVIYVNAREKIDIICKEHGLFSQTPDSHLKGVGCGKCMNKSEGRIAKYLTKNHILIRQLNINNKLYDFYLPEFNLIIERDGEQHYQYVKFFAQNDKNYFKNQRANDKKKTILAKKNGYRICRIPYWLDEKEEVIEINNILKGNPTYPDTPDLKQEKTKPRPKRNY